MGFWFQASLDNGATRRQDPIFPACGIPFTVQYHPRPAGGFAGQTDSFEIAFTDQPRGLLMASRAISYLKRKGIACEVVRYEHKEKGAAFASSATGFPLHRTIKTLVVDLG